MLATMTDSRVTAAVSHWAPRFANGIDYNDCRATAAIDSWDVWCQQWCIAGAAHESSAGRRLQLAGADRWDAPVAGAVYYHFAGFMFVNDLSRCVQRT
jgi:hypothetical protein